MLETLSLHFLPSRSHSEILFKPSELISYSLVQACNSSAALTLKRYAYRFIAYLSVSWVLPDNDYQIKCV